MANTLAYYDMASITAVINFIALAQGWLHSAKNFRLPGTCKIKHKALVIYRFPSKLMNLSIASGSY
jgi:hypothetical protein